MKHLLLAIVLAYAFNVNAQELYPGFNANPRGAEGVRIAFYNVENLFDTEDDSLKNDAEFLPDGQKHWNQRKYWIKQKQIAKTLSALGGWEAPALVGLAEVENKHTLINLVQHTSLKAHRYGFIHYESPDRRGIDVALLYRYDKVEILYSEAVPIQFPEALGGRPTRDILYAKIAILGQDTLHLFVNHWPSRWGGQMQTEPKRMHAAKVLKSKADSILSHDAQAAILIMGDLNDTPFDKSLREVLQAQPDTNIAASLYNISANARGKGTHFYKGHWSSLDQIIVSKSMLKTSGPHIKGARMEIFQAPYLLEENSFGEVSPNRTYLGMKYHGGYSDHLPVFVDVYLKTP